MHAHKVNNREAREGERKSIRMDWVGWHTGAISNHNNNKVIAHLIENINICNASPHRTHQKMCMLYVSKVILSNSVLISFHLTTINYGNPNRKHMEIEMITIFCRRFFIDGKKSSNKKIGKTFDEMT